MKQPIPFGNYYLMDLIAKGGMAEVFKAKYLGPEGFSKVVAVKRILPELSEEQEFISMFIDEAKIASQLNHANVTQILQLGEAQGTYFIAMEFVQGKDLRTLYERSRRDDGVPIRPEMAAFVLSRVCEGLDYAHRKRNDHGVHLGIIHRDVSPQNVIVSFEGDVKLIDFGIAKAQDKLVKTEAGILKGKYCYMSPEQVRGSTIDHRSDIFGLGVVLHEVLTRQRLFLGSNDLKTLENVLKKSIPPPSTINPAVPPELDQIVMKALSRDVSQRYAHASDMQEDLHRFLYSRSSVFTRRDLSGYMHHVFAADLEKEMRRLAAYEPFFAALPNTPFPSSMEQLTQTNQAHSYEMGGYDEFDDDDDATIGPTSSLAGESTSYSGPHPNPAAFHQTPPAMTAPPGMPSTPPMVSSSGAPATISMPGGYQPAPPSAAPPSFMFGSNDQYDADLDDDDEPTQLENSLADARAAALAAEPPRGFSASPSVPPPVGAAELPTRQLPMSKLRGETPQPSPGFPERSPIPGLTPPSTHGLPATAALPIPAIPPRADAPPPPPREAAPPPREAAPPPQEATPAPAPQNPLIPEKHEYYDDDLFDHAPGAQTGMQATIQQEAIGSGSSLKGWVMGMGIVALGFAIALTGLFFFRCQIFPNSCKPPTPPPPSVGKYTLVFAKPFTGVQLLLDGGPIPPEQIKNIPPFRIQLTFPQGGKYTLKVIKPGCYPISNTIRILPDMEIETPRLQLNCPPPRKAAPKPRKVQKKKRRRRRRYRRRRRR